MVKHDRLEFLASAHESTIRMEAIHVVAGRTVLRTNQAFGYEKAMPLVMALPLDRLIEIVDPPAPE